MVIIKSYTPWPRTRRDAIERVVRLAKYKFGIILDPKNLERIPASRNGHKDFIKHTLFGCAYHNNETAFQYHLNRKGILYYKEEKPLPSQPPTHCPTCGSKLPKDGKDCWCQR